MDDRLRASATLPREFFDRDSREVAVDLLGCVVEHDGVAVRLTEVEAYLGEEDPGSHAFRGRTKRTAVMFGPPGHLYVYFTYGMHWCANLVCSPEGTATAVLLRGAEVVSGLEVARGRRPTARRDVDLGRGPARLATALGLTGVQDGLDVVAPGPLRIRRGTPVPADDVRSGPRVGVSGDGAGAPWRYWIGGEPTVSVYRPGKPRKRKTVGPSP